MKKVVITGGTKLVGLNLASFLVKQGFDVHVTSRSVWSEEIKGVTFHKCDISDYEKMMEVCDGVSYIFHFASRADQDCIDYPIETELTNVGGTVKILEIAREKKIEKLVFASSAMVYGNQKEIPFKETSSIVPVEPYGLYKYFGEKLVEFWAKHYEVPAISLRFFNVYGPMDTIGPKAFVVGRFIDKYIKGEPLTIDGDGNDSRDYVFVEDVVRACLMAAENKDIRMGEVFNVGSGIETTLNELAKEIGGEVVHMDSREGARRGPSRRVADVSLIKEKIGWKPEVSVTEGIARLKSSLSIK